MTHEPPPVPDENDDKNRPPESAHPEALFRKKPEKPDRSQTSPILAGAPGTKKTLSLILTAVALIVLAMGWGFSRHLDGLLNDRLKSLASPGVTVYSSPFSVFRGEEITPSLIRQLEPNTKTDNFRTIVVSENHRTHETVKHFKLVFSRNLKFLVDIIPLGPVSPGEPGTLPTESVTLPPGFLGTIIDKTLALYRPVTLDLVSSKMKTTLLVSEDRNFYHSPALDFTGILRAFLLDLRSRTFREGGSTLTQQVVKNILLGQQKTIERKFLEVLLAVKLSRTHSPDQILTLYLNHTEWGSSGSERIIGIEAASETFFGHSAESLNYRESATLSAILRAPNRNNPVRHPKRVMAIRNRILESLGETGNLKKKRLARDIESPLGISRMIPKPPGPYFTSWAIKTIGTLPAGASVTLTMDPVLSEKVDQLVTRDLQQFDRFVQKRHPEKPPLEAAAIVMDPRSGAIMALSGGRSFRLAPFNRAIMAKRQPASLFKIVPYIVALNPRDQGPPHANIETILSNDPIAITAGGHLWRPRNAENVQDSKITLEEAFTQSLNRPILHLVRILSPKEMVRTARNLGLDTPDASDLPLSWPLGVTPQTPLQIARAYATIANGGYQVTPHAISRILSKDGEKIRSFKPLPPVVRRVIPAETAYLIGDLLRRTVASGTGQSLSRWTASDGWGGKTGTANKGRDTWFVATSPNRVVVVWAGYDDNSPTWRFGATLALPIAGKIIRLMHVTPSVSPPPPGILMNLVKTDCNDPPRIIPSLEGNPILSSDCQNTNQPPQSPGLMDQMGLFFKKIF